MFFRFAFLWLPKVALLAAMALVVFLLIDFEFARLGRDVCSLTLLGCGLCGAFSAVYLFSVGERIPCPLCGETGDFYLLHDEGRRFFCVSCVHCGIVGVEHSWADTLTQLEPRVIPECTLPDESLSDEP